jgi:hypothetical protein
MLISFITDCETVEDDVPILAERGFGAWEQWSGREQMGCRSGMLVGESTKLERL